jgi:hypothetical protein
VGNKFAEVKNACLVVFLCFLVTAITYLGTLYGLFDATVKATWWVAFGATALTSMLLGLTIHLSVRVWAPRSHRLNRIVELLALLLLFFGGLGFYELLMRPVGNPTYEYGVWFALNGLVVGLGVGYLIPLMVTSLYLEPMDEDHYSTQP